MKLNVIHTFLPDCQFRTRVGDGYCDDENNNMHCDFDRGDCCGEQCVNRDRCTECRCHLENQSKGVYNALVGDGICQDHTNNGECDFDGFDCCENDVGADSVDTTSCKYCECHGKH